MIPDAPIGHTMEALNEVAAATTEEERDNNKVIVESETNGTNSGRSSSSASSIEEVTALPLPTTTESPKEKLIDDAKEQVASIQDAEEEPRVNGEASPDEKSEENHFEERTFSSEDEDEDKLIIIEPNDAKKDDTEDKGKEDCKIAVKEELAAIKKEGTVKRPLEASTTPSTDGNSSNKKARLVEDLVSIEGLTSLPQVEGAITENAKDLKALQILLLQKEEEWNALVRLQKRKEELQMRLKRKHTLILMRKGERSKERKETEKEAADGNSSNSLMFLPQGGYSALGASQIPFMMLNQMLSGQSPQVITRPDASSKNAPQTTNGQNNISIIDIHTTSNPKSSEQSQISLSVEAQNKISRQLTSMKPILPKPFSSSILGQTPGLGSLAGFGPQGPTVSVHQLIAAHRKDNPAIPPLSDGRKGGTLPEWGCTTTAFRGAKRGAWRNRYDCEPKRPSSRDSERPSNVSSSNSEIEHRLNNSYPPNSLSNNIHSKSSGGSHGNSMLPINDPSVSYKDVLLQFAQLTQAEKQPGSPQISIIPVNNNNIETSRKLEPSPDSTSVSREHSIITNTHSSQPATENSPSSALAKLLLESGGAAALGKNPAIDLSSCSTTPQYLTLSALLSSGGTTQVKEKGPSVIKPESHQQHDSVRENHSSQASKKSSEDTSASSHGIGGNPPQSNPKCQGCHKHRAQFVCAGCGNQWYCSRECQVAAWEDHSEHCHN